MCRSRFPKPVPSLLMLCALAALVFAAAPGEIRRASPPLPHIQPGEPRAGAPPLIPAVGASLADRVAAAGPKLSAFTLDNGLGVLVLPAGRAPTAAVQVWYRVGSRDEGDREHGLAHLFEHMMFRGTDSVGPEEFSRRIQAVGGRANAYTSEDVTVYHEVLPSSHLELALELEADRMANLALDEAMLETERQVVIEEMRLRRENDPLGAVYAWYKRLFFSEHPYRHDVMGTRQSLERLTLDDCAGFYRQHYTPDNAVLVVAGDADAERVRVLAERHFGPIPREPAARGPAPPPEPFGTALVRGKLELDVEVPACGIGFHVPGASHPDYPALELIRELLTGGDGARLTRRLVERDRLAVYADTIFEPSIDPSAFVSFAVFLPSVRSATVERAMWEELDRLRQEPLPEAELERARRRLLVRRLFRLSGPEGAAAMAGRAAVIEGDAGRFSGSVARLQAVSAADVRRAADCYLVRENAVVGHVRPERFRITYFLYGLYRRLTGR